jgi:hypothetical protein
MKAYGSTMTTACNDREAAQRELGEIVHPGGNRRK